MNFLFEKYQGAGNDFIILDDRKESFPDHDYNLVKNICDRHYGIGADGLILLRASKRSDFKMLYFNANGRLGSLCGNGSRCLFAFAKKYQIIDNQGTFETSDGIIKGSVTSDDLICIEMGDVLKIEKMDSAIFMDTGSPHHVEFVDQLSSVDVKSQGAAIRYGAPYFETGSNINFVEKVNENEFNIRTYERGIEDETLACGTGAVAAAISAHFSKLTSLNFLNINALGGSLQVSFTQNLDQYKNIKLTGPAVFVFSGNLNT